MWTPTSAPAPTHRIAHPSRTRAQRPPGIAPVRAWRPLRKPRSAQPISATDMSRQTAIGSRLADPADSLPARERSGLAPPISARMKKIAGPSARVRLPAGVQREPFACARSKLPAFSVERARVGDACVRVLHLSLRLSYSDHHCNAWPSMRASRRTLAHLPDHSPPPPTRLACALIGASERLCTSHPLLRPNRKRTRKYRSCRQHFHSRHALYSRRRRLRSRGGVSREGGMHFNGRPPGPTTSPTSRARA